VFLHLEAQRQGAAAVTPAAVSTEAT
jgi:hypothetical protein